MPIHAFEQVDGERRGDSAFELLRIDRPVREEQVVLRLRHHHGAVSVGHGRWALWSRIAGLKSRSNRELLEVGGGIVSGAAVWVNTVSRAGNEGHSASDLCEQ